MADGMGYEIMIAGALSFAIIATVVIIVTSCSAQKGEKGLYLNYLRNIVNIIFLVTAKALSGPFLGLSINVLYCN